MTGSAAVGGRRFAAPVVTSIAAAVAIIGGIAATKYPVRWSSVALAGAVAVLAQFAALRFRQGTRTLIFAWGEASVIVVVYLVPSGWVPLVIGVGFLVGHALYLLRTGQPWALQKTVNIGNLALAGAAGAIVAHAIRMQDHAEVTGKLIAALIAGGIAYFLVSSVLVNVNAQALGIISMPTRHAIARTLNDKLPMVAGNITIGILVVVLLAREKMWLLLVPPVVILMHQAYVYRSRIADERRLWRDFAEVARSLNQPDQHSVAAAALDGTLRLFEAESVEIWVDREGESAHGYRGTVGTNGLEIVELTHPSAVRSELPASARALSIGASRVGEMRVWMPPASSLDGRDQMALSAVADALAAALDAAAPPEPDDADNRKLPDSYRDVLTGLASRTSLLCEGGDRLKAAGPTPFALLVLGINRFKEVNDTLGPTAGDELLRIIAERVASAAGTDDLVARIGGDEFAILTELLGHPDVGLIATERAEALANGLSKPTEIAGMQVAVEVSVGVAVARTNELELTELVRRAGIAMRRAKRSAGTVATYNAADAASGGVDRLSVLVDLREALEREDQLVLAVQPAVDLATGRPIAAETLIRWRHPRRGPLAPRDFLDLVDQSDLVMPFNRYVLDRALRLADTWSRNGMAIRVAVNLSTRSLADPNLPGDVASLLKTHGVEPKMLTLEIKESAVVASQPVVGEVLTALRAQGVQLAVDDFGSGYSSLTFLARVQVDEVKVDSTFVAAMTESAEAAAIVRTTVDLGRRLGIRVVAEGVETRAQQTALTELGCAAAQGWHIMPPVAAERAIGVMRELAANERH